MTSAASSHTTAEHVAPMTEENTPLNATELADWYKWCVKWDSLQGKRLYATIMSARARAEAAEAESARLREVTRALRKALWTHEVYDYEGIGEQRPIRRSCRLCDADEHAGEFEHKADCILSAQDQ